MKCLVFAEQASRPLVKSSRDVAARCKEFGHEVVVAAYALPGQDTSALVGCGADEAIVVMGNGFVPYDPGIWCAQLVDLMEREPPDAVLFTHTYAGREIAARIAQKFDVPLASDVISIEELDSGHAIAKRMVHGGKAIEVLELTGYPVLVTVRPGAWHASAAPSEALVREVSPSVTPEDALLQMVEFARTASERPSLDEAEVVVAVGRGCNEPARAHAAELADLLGAALGSSRGMVDSGVVGYDTQVGQTGKTIAPHLYIACGISGSIQHQAGMSRSELIVAINTDENAPIFEIADLGIQADAEDTLRELVRLICALPRPARGLFLDTSHRKER